MDAASQLEAQLLPAPGGADAALPPQETSAALAALVNDPGAGGVCRRDRRASHLAVPSPRPRL